MAEVKEQKFYVGTLVQERLGTNPSCLYTLVSLPNESMGQLASRLEQYRKAQGFNKANGYNYEVYLGELTHQIPPPPPPPPMILEKIEVIPVAVPKKIAAKLKAIKPA